MDVHPDGCPFEDVLRAQIMYARERLAGARERRTLIDISEVAKASVRLINKKWTVYASSKKPGSWLKIEPVVRTKRPTAQQEIHRPQVKKP